MAKTTGLLTILSLTVALPAGAQSNAPAFEAAVQVAMTRSSAFDATDAGVGGRFSWLATPLFGADAEFTFYPGDLDAGTVAFSASRVEGLFGITVGPDLGRMRPFARARAGFVAFREAPAPFACILIFPPTLPCALAGGDTLLAIDLGGGLALFPTTRTVIRFDLGDRMTRYPGPAIAAGGDVHDAAFFGHDLRVSVGGGVRF